MCDKVFTRCSLFVSFLGYIRTGKYPDEDYYNAYLNSNGGSSNAFTSNEVRRW